MAFLLKYQRVLFCTGKNYFLKKRLHQRRYLFLQSQKIQCLYRNYRSALMLNAIAEVMKQEKRRKLIVNLNANLVISFFKMIHQRITFLKKHNACIVVQNFVRESNLKRKKKKQNECRHKIHVIDVVEKYSETVHVYLIVLLGIALILILIFLRAWNARD